MSNIISGILPGGFTLPAITYLGASRGPVRMYFRAGTRGPPGPLYFQVFEGFEGLLDVFFRMGR